VIAAFVLYVQQNLSGFLNLLAKIYGPEATIIYGRKTTVADAIDRAGRRNGWPDAGRLGGPPGRAESVSMIRFWNLAIYRPLVWLKV
jgi:hypothetical protein